MDLQNLVQIREFQTILPIRGKILNVEKASMDKILAMKEIRRFIYCYGNWIWCRVMLQNALSKLVIMTDTD